MADSFLSFRQFMARQIGHPGLAQLLIELSLAVLQRAANPAPPTSYQPGVFNMPTVSHPRPPMSRTAPRFPLGRLVATPHALSVLTDQGIPPVTLLERHARGDWGDLEAEDIQANQDALAHGWRLFSSYAVGQDIKVWIITEADRSVTTILMPDDY
jgi:hypothetical protein